MSPILLLCGIHSSLQAEIHSRCKNAIPGVTLLFLNTLDEVSRYLSMEVPYTHRDYPAPHFMILHVERNQFDPVTLSELKKRKQFSRIPIILMAEGVGKTELKPAFEWLYAGVVEAPSDFTLKIDMVVEAIRYWVGIVKLPLI